MNNEEGNVPQRQLSKKNRRTKPDENEEVSHGVIHTYFTVREASATRRHWLVALLTTRATICCSATLASRITYNEGGLLLLVDLGV